MSHEFWFFIVSCDIPAFLAFLCVKMSHEKSSLCFICDIKYVFSEQCRINQRFILFHTTLAPQNPWFYQAKKVNVAWNPENQFPMRHSLSYLKNAGRLMFRLSGILLYHLTHICNFYSSSSALCASIIFWAFIAGTSSYLANSIVKEPLACVMERSAIA